MGGSGSGCLMRVQMRHWPETQKPESSTVTKESTSNLICMVIGSLQFLTGCSQHHFAIYPPQIRTLVLRQGKAVIL